MEVNRFYRVLGHWCVCGAPRIATLHLRRQSLGCPRGSSLRWTWCPRIRVRPVLRRFPWVSNLCLHRPTYSLFSFCSCRSRASHRSNPDLPGGDILAFHAVFCWWWPILSHLVKAKWTIDNYWNSEQPPQMRSCTWSSWFCCSWGST